MEKKTRLNAIEVAALGQPSDSVNRERARRVIDAWVDSAGDGEGEVFEEWKRNLKAAIAENLDADSILYFIQTIGRHKESAIRHVAAQRAATGRRAIGVASRQKVATAAEPYRHLSKGNAAHEIAQIVSLDAGTVKRYLTELFPGKDWKKPRIK